MALGRKSSIFLTDLEEFPTIQNKDFCLKIDLRYLSENSKNKAKKTLNETDEIKERALKKLSELIQSNVVLYILSVMVIFFTVNFQTRKISLCHTTINIS